MKADINENGCLIVYPETQTETFALKTWYDGLHKFESMYSLKIITELDHSRLVNEDRKQ